MNANLRKLLPISANTEQELLVRGLVSFSSRSWRFGDHANGTTRSLNGKKYVRSDNHGPDWHKLIGLADVIDHDRGFVIFVLEGSKDAVAALELADRAGLLCQVGLVTAQGTGYRPILSELQQLRGRKVLLVGDRDPAGIDAARRVSEALMQDQVDHVVWNWNSFDDGDGKDLFDLLEASSRRKKAASNSTYLQFFSFFFPSNGSTVQQFNSHDSVPSGGFNSSTHIGIHELIKPFVVNKRGTGNARSFDLARALRGREARAKDLLTNEEIDEIFHHWFRKSQPFLPPDANEDKSLRQFYKQIRRVRYLPSDLNSAIQRARTLPLPDVATLNDDALKVAALMRELQRIAGDKSFICPVNVIVDFVPLRFAEQAKRLLWVLEKAAVIQCIERGMPHVSGKPGKSSIWRYKLSIDPIVEPAVQMNEANKSSVGSTPLNNCGGRHANADAENGSALH